GEPRRVAYLYILPAVTVFALFVLYPLIRSGVFSLYDWDGLGTAEWAGLANYQAVFTEPALRGAFVHALVLIVFYAIIPVTLGLMLAATMSRARMAGLGFFRVELFLPQVIPLVVVAVAWRQIYEPQGPLNSALRADGLDAFVRPWLVAVSSRRIYEPLGPLNSALRAVGLDALARPWRGDYAAALPSVGLVGTWIGTGLCLILFLAGMAKIPRELYEAARLDGAGRLREFTAITLPSVRGELSVALTLTVIAALKTFDLVYVMTSGGPGRQTTVPSYEVYNNAFLIGRVGTATALAIVLTVVVFLVTVVINRVGEKAQ